MAKNKNFTYKTTFYCIRGLLSAEIAAKAMVPELLIDKLFEQFETGNDVIKIAKDTLEKKRQKSEKSEVDQKEKPIIISAIRKQINSIVPKFTDESEKRKRLDSFLRE
jgi:predicted nucleotidyltransferase